MVQMNRRQFLKYGAQLAAVLGLSETLTPQVAEALAEMAHGTAPVIWLQGLSCSGCSVSLLNSDTDTVAEVLTRYISLRFHSSLMTGTGQVSMDVLKHSIAEKGYVLVTEGAVPAGMPLACRVGGELYTEQLARAAQNASAIITVGACACFGGVPGAENNPTGAVSVPDYLASQKITTPFIRVPGCPAHPDWLVGTIVHVLKFGMPELDKLNRPKMFYGRCLHDQCNRFPDYEREAFATKFGEQGCLFKLGCAGPITYADCPLRHWNSGANYCINAGVPCIGCAAPHFAHKANYPLYTKRSPRSLKELKDNK